MTTATPPTQVSKAPAPRPGGTEFLDEMNDAAAGIGLWTTTLFGIVPGFLPTVALTVVAVAVIVIPVLIVGAGLGAAFGLLLVFGRLVSRGFSLVTTDRHDADDSKDRKPELVHAEPEAALH